MLLRARPLGAVMVGSPHLRQNRPALVSVTRKIQAVSRDRYTLLCAQREAGYATVVTAVERRTSSPARQSPFALVNTLSTSVDGAQSHPVTTLAGWLTAYRTGPAQVSADYSAAKADSRKSVRPNLAVTTIFMQSEGWRCCSAARRSPSPATGRTRILRWFTPALRSDQRYQAGASVRRARRRVRRPARRARRL